MLKGGGGEGGGGETRSEMLLLQCDPYTIVTRVQSESRQFSLFQDDKAKIILHTVSLIL